MEFAASGLFLLALAANLLVLQKLLLGRVWVVTTIALLLCAEAFVLIHDPVNRFFYQVVDQVIFRGGCIP